MGHLVFRAFPESADCTGDTDGRLYLAGVMDIGYVQFAAGGVLHLHHHIGIDEEKDWGGW
jgi:hypothetical protein